MMKKNFVKGMAAVLAAAALTAVFAGCGGNKKDNGAAGKTADASSVKNRIYYGLYRSRRCLRCGYERRRRSGRGGN